MITLHTTGSTSFTNLGLGSLSDVISCPVVEEINGLFELSMEYPITGIHYSDIQLRRIIYCKPNPYTKPQPFRIYSISKPINRIVTINACHISYDTSGYPVNEFTSNSAVDAFAKLKSNAQVYHPFTFNSTVVSTETMTIDTPRSTRSVLGNDILSTYGGEFEYDGFTIYHRQNRGLNRGVSIRYGKNLIDLKQEENVTDVYTGVYPYWVGQDADTQEPVFVKLAEKIVNVPGTFDFTKILPLDMSTYFNEKPTEQELRDMTNLYITVNNIGVPTVSLEVSFIQLSRSSEYAQYAILEEVRLGDTVSVEFREAGVSATARCIKTTYNAVTDKYDSIELGDGKSNIASTISENRKELNNKIEEQKIKFDAEVGSIKIGMATIDLAMIAKADIKYLEANFAHIINGYIDNAIIKNLTSENIQSGGINSDRLNVSDGFIKDAMIGSVNASKINSGEINTNNVRIVSEDGGIELADSTMQFRDKAGNVRIQIGQDAAGNFDFLIIGSDGKSVLINQNGITENAITDGLIKNQMIGEGEIGGSKINIDSMINSVNEGTSTIKGSKIYLDTSEQTLDIAFKALKTESGDNKELLESHTTSIRTQAGQIGTLIEDVSVVTEAGTIKLKDAYSSIEQKVGSVTTRVGNLESTLPNTVTSVDVMYALGDSSSIPPITGWYTEAPEWAEGKFMWSKTVTVYVNGHTTTSDPTCLTGAKGDEGVAYRVEIISSNGSIFKNGVINTILSAVVYSNGENITDKLNAASFKWIKTNSDGTLDDAWNTEHAGGTKTIIITPNDVYVRSSFRCDIDV